MRQAVADPVRFTFVTTASPVSPAGTEERLGQTSLLLRDNNADVRQACIDFDRFECFDRTQDSFCPPRFKGQARQPVTCCCLPAVCIHPASELALVCAQLGNPRRQTRDLTLGCIARQAV